MTVSAMSNRFSIKVVPQPQRGQHEYDYSIIQWGNNEEIGRITKHTNVVQTVSYYWIIIDPQNQDNSIESDDEFTTWEHAFENFQKYVETAELAVKLLSPRTINRGSS